MTIGNYITEKFQRFGITLSEAELLDISLSSGLSMLDEMNGDVYNKVSVGIAKFIPILFASAKSVSENGFSMTWDLGGLEAYYDCMCKQYGLKNEITSKPQVNFIQ